MFRKLDLFPNCSIFWPLEYRTMDKVREPSNSEIKVLSCIVMAKREYVSAFSLHLNQYTYLHVPKH
jgi:hypothetical protein